MQKNIKNIKKHKKTQNHKKMLTKVQKCKNLSHQLLVLLYLFMIMWGVGGGP